MADGQQDVRYALMAAEVEQAERAVDPVVELGHLEDAAIELRGLQVAAAESARAQGVSWERIGGALGVSRQAAWLRYGGGTRV